MPENQITHNNHYVPQFYLRNWSLDGKQIYVYSLLVSDSQVPYWVLQYIKSTAAWNDFYTRNNGEAEIDDFEKWFNSEFESPVQRVLDSIKNGCNINKQDEKILSRFLAAQHLRTPARLNSLLRQWRTEMPLLFDNTLKNTSKQLESGLSVAKDQTPKDNEDNLLPIKVSVEKDLGQVKVESLVGKGMYLFALKHLLTKTVSVMYKYKWHVIHAADGISFPTSDDPVICMNYNSEHEYDFRGGWGKKNGNIIMPISPNLLLITQIGSNIPCTQLDYSEHWSKFFRKIIIEHAYRYVYAIEPQRGMLAINPRRVNAELYAREKNSMAGWHDEQMEEEARLR